MPVYEYVCEETGDRIEEDLPMDQDHPEEIERDGKIYRRIFGNVALTVPYGFVMDRNKVKFDKSPSRRKHVW